MSLTFVQGDTAPSISAVIHEEDTPANVVNLTSATVRFQMRKSDDRKFTINATATIVNAVAGTVRYDWGSNDLSISGSYLVQWEVTYPGGRIQTTAPEVPITVRRQ